MNDPATEQVDDGLFGADPIAAFDDTPAAAAADTPAADAGMSEFLDAFKDEPEVVQPPTEGDAPAAEAETVDPIDEIPEPARASSAAKESFAKLKAIAKEEKARAAELERRLGEETGTRDTELADLRAKVAKLPELEEKAKFVEETEARLAKSDVQNSAEFQRTILDPLEAIGARAETIAKANDIKLADLEDALAETDPDKQAELIDELVASLKPTDQQRIIRMADDSRELLLKRAEIIKNAAEARKEVEAAKLENETKAQKAAREAYESAADNAIVELKKRVPFVALADGETADGVFQTVQDKVRAADFEKATPATKAYAAAAAVLLPRVTKQLTAAQATIKTLEARIAEGNASRPKVNASETPPQSKDIDFVDDIYAHLGVRAPSKGLGV